MVALYWLNVNVQMIEEKNIKIKCKALETLINEETHNINQRLFGFDTKHKIRNLQFRYNISADKIKEYISYIYDWNGIKFISQQPVAFKEYEKKARNWLNGRRPKKYGNNLFVDMLNNVLLVR